MSEGKYIVVETQRLSKLVEGVNDCIKKGYEPLGGMTTAVTDHWQYYYQTMYRRELAQNPNQLKDNS